MIGGQVTATRIRTPGQASNGKHWKIGPKNMTASNGKIGPKQMTASNGQHGRDWAEQSYSWANWAAPPKTDRSLVRGWESLQRRKIRRELQRQNKPVPPKLQPKNLDLKRLSKRQQQAERQSLQRELYQLERALMRTRDKKSKMHSGRISWM